MWRVTVEQRPLLACCALWIRAAERIETPRDPLVPGPLDLDDPPDPTYPGDPETLTSQWTAWWHAIVGPPGGTTIGAAEPAHDTIDPLGLASHPELAAVVRQRGPDAVRWHASGIPETRAPLDAEELVTRAEAKLERQAGAFDLHLTLLPVRDHLIRTAVRGRQYLVPEGLIGGSGFRAWLTDLIGRVM
jgi:hypothetical protein